MPKTTEWVLNFLYINLLRRLHLSSLGKVPIEIFPGKRHITWALTVLLFAAEFQLEPLARNATTYTYDITPATY